MTFQDTVQVTATRFGEPVVEVPGSISVVTGDEIRARGATDLRTALALLGGVSVAPGGDAGPAGAVPGLLGVREVDDLLLLIDGIPAGGAFIPQVEAISLNNVERIEVMRGAAPVYFGTTAFAGTINVIHYAAGSADRVDRRPLRQLSVGRRRRRSGSVDRPRAPIDQRRAEPGQSLRRARRLPARPGHLAARHSAGRRHVPRRCRPARAAPEAQQPGADRRSDRRFSTLLPVDYNQNPANAGWTPIATRWCSTTTCRCPSDAGATRPRIRRRQTDSVRGFIDAGDTPQPWTPKTIADLESFKQSLRSQGTVHRQQSDDAAGDEDRPDRRRQPAAWPRRCRQPPLRPAAAARRRQPGAEHRNGQPEGHGRFQRSPPLRRPVRAEPLRADPQHQPAGRVALEHHA